MDGAVSNAAVGTWVIILFMVANGAVGIVGIFSLFATRREVDKIDGRVDKLETANGTVREEMRKMKDELTYSADRRSSVLHSRINPVVENLAALKASSEAFVTCFDNFTEVMKTLVTRERETKECPHDN
jgi:tetrahydromethanopterin S-methyltransferase subunit B